MRGFVIGILTIVPPLRIFLVRIKLAFTNALFSCNVNRLRFQLMLGTETGENSISVDREKILEIFQLQNQNEILVVSLRILGFLVS